MTDMHPILEILAIDTVVWGTCAGIIILSVLAAVKPIFLWPINTENFLKFVEDLLRDGDQDRIEKLIGVVPEKAHLPRLVMAWIDGDDVRALHQELAKDRKIHLIKLAFVDVLVTAVIAVTLIAWSMGHTDARLIVASVISFAAVSMSIYNTFKIGSDCSKFMNEGIERLSAARAEGGSSW